MSLLFDTANLNFQSYLDMPEQSEPGYIVNHSDAFRKSRSNRVQRYDAQINKLVVRLSKLLAPGTPIGNDKKRREFEQLVCITAKPSFCIRTNEKY